MHVPLKRERECALDICAFLTTFDQVNHEDPTIYHVP
jgi:hypothetical protein